MMLLVTSPSISSAANKQLNNKHFKLNIMKNNKLKSIHSKFELTKSNADVVILNSELDMVRGGKAGDNTGCGATLNYKCGKDAPKGVSN